PHESGVRPGRRQADPRQQEIGGMVFEGGGQVLGTESARHSWQSAERAAQAGIGRGESGVRSGAGGLQEDFGGECDGITQTGRQGDKETRRTACFSLSPCLLVSLSGSTASSPASPASPPGSCPAS